MIVIIKEKDWGDIPLNNDIFYYEYVNEFGLDYMKYHHYKVIDKQLFFLSVIKHGIGYQEINCSV